MKMINIGYSNMVAVSKLVAAINPDSAPIRRLVQEARDAKILVDATAGRRMRSVLMMDSGAVILSALQPETIASRVQEVQK